MYPVTLPHFVLDVQVWYFPQTWHRRVIEPSDSHLCLIVVLHENIDAYSDASFSRRLMLMSVELRVLSFLRHLAK